MSEHEGLTPSCWAALRGDPSGLAALRVRRRGRWLAGPFAVGELAVGAVSAGLLAAAELAEARGAGHLQITLSAEHVALSFRSEHHVTVEGRALPIFVPLSRFVRCAHDRWARTHDFYPHHAAALRKALAIEPAENIVSALTEVASGLEATELEERVVEAGGCAAAVRSPQEWASHPAGHAVAREPWVGWSDDLAVNPPPRLAQRRGQALARHELRRHPAAGMRVLDATRVLAGPIASRTLAALGADVLRIDPPELPEVASVHVDTGPGKRSATLDLADAEVREHLLAGADLFLCGYRPGAVARFGLEPAELAHRHPHLAQVWLSAWGWSGPWSTRRGFDSLVQAASGIAWTLADTTGTPGVLPAQALDHATGHLMAAAALRLLAMRERGEPIRPARLSLARTAKTLTAAAMPSHAQPADPPDPAGARVTFGDISLIGPPGEIDGRPLAWDHGPRPLGGDEPSWD